MANPFKPGSVYYARVPTEHVLDNECRDNPDQGPRPWLILYCRQHQRTGLVIAAPLYTKGDAEIASQTQTAPDHFDDCRDGTGIFSAGWIHLEQLRALDKARLDLERGPIACMKKVPFQAVRATLMGMFEPRLLPQ